MPLHASFSATVKKFSGASGWIYVEVPKDTFPEKVPTGPWGQIKCVARAGKTTWSTSLLPMGNGKKFIALKAAVRKKERIVVGDRVTAIITLTI